MVIQSGLPGITDSVICMSGQCSSVIVYENDTHGATREGRLLIPLCFYQVRQNVNQTVWNSGIRLNSDPVRSLLVEYIFFQVYR